MRLDAAANERDSSWRLEPAVVKQLSKRSLWRSVAYIAFQWAIIVACIVITHRSSSYLALLPCLFIIATRQHAFAAVVHEGCHYNLCESKPLNDFLTNMFAGFPLSISVKRYRNSHLAHHRLVNEDNDPDLEENTPPASRLELFKLLLQDICFLSIRKNLKRGKKFGVFAIFKEKGEGWKTERYLYLTFAAIVVVSATYFGGWKYVGLYWFVPQFSILQAISRLRGYSEHAGLMEESDELLKSRSVDANWLEGFVFGPARVNRHLEHHLYPAVPFFNLEKLHRLLAEKSPPVAPPTATRGYMRWPNFKRSVFGEIYAKTQASAPPAE